ncbi:thioredoxin family protein [Candidatus Saccharibacteria bacterium]|nr:thioredoxin family protein [Candidatus Saccharibacteria bacterium]
MAKQKSSPKTTKKPAVKKPATKKPKTVHATEPYHPAFGVILIIVCALMAAVLLPFAIKKITESVESDAMRFSGEYSSVEVDNVFKYKTAEETKDILEHGTGVVFLGFPSCPWCQSYAKMLNDLAKEKGLTEIYYYNIHDDRENNTEIYQKFVSVLGDYLQYDNTGKKRIYVPNATFIVDGEIIGNNLETSKDTLGLQNPDDYWTEERVATWKEKIGALMEKVKSAQGCATTCNE